MSPPQKVIVWGYPLHTHTHSYGHAAAFKAFKYLGYETYWFHDDEYPKDFDYDNCIFWTEGYAERNIPIKKSSTYFVHVCVNPKKYLEVGARIIDVRYNVKEIFDVNYHYTRDLNRVTQVTDNGSLYYEKLTDDSGLTNRLLDGENIEYEALYMTWGTDLYPEEILDEFVDIKKENSIYWLGTISAANSQQVVPFAQNAQRNGIQFIHNDPWNRPLNFEVVQQLTQVSYLAPEIRGSGDHDPTTGHTGTNHLFTGYIGERLFKNISYGQLGITNSLASQELLDGNLIFNLDTAQLFEDGVKNRDNKNLILEQMKLIREKHTWVKRLSDVMGIL